MVEIPVEHAERKEGKSRYSLFKLVELLLDLLTGFSMLPLRVLSVIGLVLASCGIAFGLLLLILRLLFGPEWAEGGVFTLLRFYFSLWAVSLLHLGPWVNTSGGFMMRFDGDPNLWSGRRRSLTSSPKSCEAYEDRRARLS